MKLKDKSLFKSLVAGALLVGSAGALAVAVDTDGDGIDDSVDNCPAVANADQRNSDNLLPKAFASTTGWTSANGFGACAGISTSTACMDGTHLVFSYVQDTVSRSFAVTNPSFVQLSVDVSAYVGNGNNGNDSGSVTLNAYDAGDVLLDTANWSSNAIDGSVQHVALTLSNTAAFPQVTRLEVVFTGVDNGGWGGNYGSNFSAFSLVTDSTGDACDDDDDNDGILDTVDTFPTNPNIGTLSKKVGGVTKDAVGRSVAFAGDFDGDGYGDYVIGIPGYDIPAAPPLKAIKDAGRAEVISGKDGSLITYIVGKAAKDALGSAVAGNADINNDGYADVVIGTPKADVNGLVDAGSVTVMYGGPMAPLPETINGTVAKSLFGSALALGDVNADGNADIIIGAPKDDDVTNKLVDAGSVTVINGNGLTTMQTYYGATARAYAGTSVAAGAVDGAAGADIIVGAPNDDDVANKRADAGSVTVYNIADGAVHFLKQYGAVAKAYFGKSVASGNVNNDAYDDVLVGAPGDDDTANSLKDTGSVTVLFGNNALPSVMKYGKVAKAGLGNSVAAGDVNGDGYADIVAGASKDDSPTIPKVTKDTGSVTVWSGSDYALIKTVYGKVTKDYFGTSVATGDIDGDGKLDLMIGATGYEVPVTKPVKPVKDVGSVELLSGDSL